MAAYSWSKNSNDDIRVPGGWNLSCSIRRRQLFSHLKQSTEADTVKDIFDVDLFETASSTIQNLQARGAKVICYFSAGTSEDWRPDYNQFTSTDKGSELPDWKGEKYLNLRSANVLRIMKARIANAASIGCDAIDPDNMGWFRLLDTHTTEANDGLDGFTNTNGLGLAAADSTLFMRALAAEAAKYGMSTGLKNAQSIIASVADVVQFAVNEECKTVTKDCGVYDEFVAEKPVFHGWSPSLLAHFPWLFI